MDQDCNRSEYFQHADREHSPFSIECLSINGSDHFTPSCRICQTSGNSEPEVGELLPSPCDCRGSLGFVHKQCMERWLCVRNQDTCELCHFKFVTKRRFKPLHEWHFGQAVEMLSSDEKGILVLGFVNFILLLLEVPFVYYVIRINAAYFLEHINDRDSKPGNFFRGLHSPFGTAANLLNGSLCVVSHIHCVWLQGVSQDFELQ
ncbi:hypothetical protein ACROYT_G005706 [Oculina patagonica]